MAYPSLAAVIEQTTYEKKIIVFIDEILDEYGIVKDTASQKLASIRMGLYKKRAELKRVFDRIVGKLKKLGYLADIEESFLKGSILDSRVSQFLTLVSSSLIS